MGETSSVKSSPVRTLYSVFSRCALARDIEIEVHEVFGVGDTRGEEGQHYAFLYAEDADDGDRDIALFAEQFFGGADLLEELPFALFRGGALVAVVGGDQLESGAQHLVE